MPTSIDPNDALRTLDAELDRGRSLVAGASTLEALEDADRAVLLEADRVYVTLPGRRPRLGSLHPLIATEYRIVDIFTRMGYRVVEGPEVENDWYNFQALNIPPDHRATAAARLRGGSRAGVPAGHARRHPLSGLPPGRGPGRGRRAVHGGPE